MSSVAFNQAFGPDYLANLNTIGNMANGPVPLSFDPTAIGPLPVGSSGAVPMGGAPNLSGIGGIAGAANPWSQKLGFNMGTANLALSGLQTIAGLWGAFKAASLAKKQFRATNEINQTNLNNQIRSYNTALEDRARSRAVVEGQTAEQTQTYIDQNKARRG
jgi:hypothetical protein